MMYEYDVGDVGTICRKESDRQDAMVKLIQLSVLQTSTLRNLRTHANDSPSATAMMVILFVWIWMQ